MQQVIYILLFLFFGATTVFAQKDTSKPSPKYFISLASSSNDTTAEDLMKEAVLHFDGGRFARAVNSLDQAIKINEYPQLTNILYYYRANAKAKLQQFEAAIIDYNEAIAFANNKSHYYYHRAYAHFENENFENAEKDFTTYMAMEGESADIYMKLGFLKQKENDLHGAIASYSKAIILQPKLAEAYFLRGAIYLQVLLHQKGCKDMKKAADLGHERADRRYSKYCD